MNLFGVQLFKVIQNMATVAKILPFVLFIGMGVFFIDSANFTPLFPGGEYTPGSFGTAAVMLFFTFTKVSPLPLPKWKTRKRICRKPFWLLSVL